MSRIKTTEEIRRVNGVIATAESEIAPVEARCKALEQVLSENEREAENLRRKIMALRETGTVTVKTAVAADRYCTVEATTAKCRYQDGDRLCIFRLWYDLPAGGELRGGRTHKIGLRGKWKCNAEIRKPPYRGYTIGLDIEKGFANSRDDQYLDGWKNGYCSLLVGQPGKGPPTANDVSHSCEIYVPEAFPASGPYEIVIVLSPYGGTVTWRLE